MEGLETSRVEEWAESQQGSGTADRFPVQWDLSLQEADAGGLIVWISMTTDCREIPANELLDENNNIKQLLHY
ncbi:hypothetical protein EYF80_049231 [Liparis tanakae]|uniref:Uncharacterized protein n=1 Tax=Liparis tanakae TaxID=230148 RepID=A0A4Z2FI31_9TELE|nr:hypothetical protein EYF80_049231 [Liparis tanakae]